jgi:hypothetical protein
LSFLSGKQNCRKALSCNKTSEKKHPELPKRVLSCGNVLFRMSNIVLDQELDPGHFGGSPCGPMCLQFDVYRMYEVSPNTEA